MAEYFGANNVEDDSDRNTEEPQGSGISRTTNLQSYFTSGTEELEAEEPSEEMELAIAVLLNIIEVHDGYILVFIRNEECSPSQEVISMIRGVSDIHVETSNLAELERNFKGFHRALEKCITIDPPPLIFNKGRYVGNHSTFVRAYRFQRVDILLEPPKHPWYHIIVMGSGHGAQMIVEEVKRNHTGLKVALVKIPSPIPYQLHSNCMRRFARYVIWAQIQKLSGSSNDPRSFWSHSTHDNLKEKPDLIAHCLDSNVDYYSGIVQFVSKDTVRVYPSTDESSSTGLEENEDEAPTNLMGMNYILCPGCLPKFQPFPGIEYAMSLQTFICKGIIPQATLLIGNTPEIFETAHLLALGGGEVTIMTLSKRWLPTIDNWYAQQIIHGFRTMNVAFVMIRKIINVTEVDNDELQIEVIVRDRKKCLTGYYSAIVIDFPTVPASATMDLEKAEVKLDNEGKVEVNDVYRTSNPIIYAFGSVVCGHPTYPKFEIMAGIKTIRYVVKGVNDVLVPSISPTLVRAPLELASVGATRKTVELKDCEMLVVNKAQNQFFYIELICTRTKNWSGEIYRKKNDQVKGVHILGYDVSCLIAGVDTLIENGLTKCTLIQMMARSKLFKKLPISRISFTSRKYFKNLEHRHNYLDKGDSSGAENSDASSIYTQRWYRKSSREHENSDMDCSEDENETESIKKDVPVNRAGSIDWRKYNEQFIYKVIANVFASFMITNVFVTAIIIFHESNKIGRKTNNSASKQGASIVINGTGRRSEVFNGMGRKLILSPHTSNENIQYYEDSSSSGIEEDHTETFNYAVNKRCYSCQNFGEADKLKCFPRSNSTNTLGIATTARSFLTKSEAEDANLNHEKTELVPKELYYLVLLVTTSALMLNEHLSLFHRRITSPLAELTEGDLNLIVLLDNEREREESEFNNLERENSEYLIQDLHSAILVVTSLLVINNNITLFRHRIRSPSAELTENDLNVMEYLENNGKVPKNEFFVYSKGLENPPTEQAKLTSAKQKKTKSRRIFGLLECNKKNSSCVLL